MFAYLAAIEFLFDDADLPDVDASRLYRDRADEAKSECKDGAAAAAAADDDGDDGRAALRRRVPRAREPRA